MTQNSILQFEGHQVRMVVHDGEPWWIAKDVCDILHINQPTRAVERLDLDEKGVTTIHTPGGAQEVITVNEAGLYSLILRSRKPEAKQFKRWVTHEVLPSLRKTGMYIVPSPEEGGVFAGAMELARQFTSVENRLARIEAAQEEARSMAIDLPRPLGVFPELSRIGEIKVAARLFCQMTGTKAGAVWAIVYTELEFRYGVRIGARKKKAGFKGSTLEFAILDGHGDKLYTILDQMLQRYINLRTAA